MVYLFSELVLSDIGCIVISEPPGVEEGFNEISKVEVRLICDIPFKVILWPCLYKIPVGIKK